MLVGIHQLHYLPWLRYFEKIARSDVFIVLDNIQYGKNNWQNRNKVKTSGGVTLLTVPVVERLGQTLDQVKISPSAPWQRRHWRTIEQSYRRAPFFEEHAPFLQAVYHREWEYLNDLNRHMLDYFVRVLGITSRVFYSSELNVPGVATERLVNLIKAVSGDEYYSGAFAAQAYLDADMFRQAGIGLVFQEWHAPVYPQLHGEFAPDLSIIDLLLNCGPESLTILLSGGSGETA